MAQLELDIPDIHIPRIVEAIKPFLEEGDAVDLENPTNAEAAAKLKQYLIKYIKNFVLNSERANYSQSFIFEDIPII